MADELEEKLAMWQIQGHGEGRSGGIEDGRVFLLCHISILLTPCSCIRTTKVPMINKFKLISKSFFLGLEFTHHYYLHVLTLAQL